MKKIDPIKIKPGMKVDELIRGMNGLGFGAGKLAKASDIINKMVSDKECKVFFGLAGAMVPAGMSEVIIDFLDYVDVFVTTGATLTHDLIGALGESHYKGGEEMDDFELYKRGYDRMYNVLMRSSVYEKLEDFFTKNFDEFQKCRNISEFLLKIGELTPGRSILRKCYEKRIPIFCPGIADSGIGLMMWGKIVQDKKTSIDVFSDMKEIIDIAWTSKKTGVFYVGGGLPKNFIQQSMQFSKKAVYGVQITTSRAEPGGSSGASLKEGISWGKMSEKAEYVDVFCDATIAMPILLAGLKK